MIENHNGIKAVGHVLIRDKVTKEVLCDKHNEINVGNMSEAIALSLGRNDRGFIEEMHFGNGGSVMSSIGEIDYNPPNVEGNSDLYNPTFSKVINQNSPYFTDITDNTNITISEHIDSTNYTDIVITCTLGYNEPSDATLYDDMTVTNTNVQKPDGSVISNTDNESKYIFDELALKSVNRRTGERRLLSHVIFHPVQKSLNRAIEIIYTIRISVE